MAGLVWPGRPTLPSYLQLTNSISVEIGAGRGSRAPANGIKFAGIWSGRACHASLAWQTRRDRGLTTRQMAVRRRTRHLALARNGIDVHIITTILHFDGILYTVRARASNLKAKLYLQWYQQF